MHASGNKKGFSLGCGGCRCALPCFGHPRSAHLALLRCALSAPLMSRPLRLLAKVRLCRTVAPVGFAPTPVKAGTGKKQSVCACGTLASERSRVRKPLRALDSSVEVCAVAIIRAWTCVVLALPPSAPRGGNGSRVWVLCGLCVSGLAGSVARLPFGCSPRAVGTFGLNSAAAPPGPFVPLKTSAILP